jgi:hypothetical protein
MNNERIDSAMAEQILQGDDTDPDILQSLGLELIAELKRCYEELDKANKEGEALWNVLDNWDICMDDYSMHDQYENLDEKYDRDNEGRIILKELYSYTEEDGWQPKESASE